jgi:mono/diheme cytochrome c family protein
MRGLRAALAILVVAAAAGLVGLAGVRFVQAQRDRFLVVAEQQALRLELERVEWVRHPGGDNDPAVPVSMMPGMPARGSHRLHVEFTVVAPSVRTYFSPDELELRHAGGDVQLPTLSETPERRLLEIKQELITSVDFDVAEGERGLRLCWHRGTSDTCLMPLDSPAPQQAAPVEKLPARAAALAAGDAAAGARLYHGRLGCVTCHGEPGAGAPHLGPDLRGIGVAAASRVAGTPARQFLYEALIDPNASIAPGYSAPSAMPYYGDSLSRADAADLLAFLEGL